jgi:prevent-host-death family protein
MLLINIYQAKARLSELITQALAGKDVIITKAGEPKVKLIPVAKILKERQPGIWKGKIRIDKEFDTLPKELTKLFNGN